MQVITPPRKAPLTLAFAAISLLMVPLSRAQTENASADPPTNPQGVSETFATPSNDGGNLKGGHRGGSANPTTALTGTGRLLGKVVCTGKQDTSRTAALDHPVGDHNAVIGRGISLRYWLAEIIQWRFK